MASSASERTDRTGRATTGWGWVLATGILMVIAGLIALFLPGLATVSMALFLGWLLLLYGIAGIVMGIRSRHGRGHPTDLLYGVISLIVGVVLLVFPIWGAFWLPLVASIWLLVRGIVELAAAARHRRERGLLILSGVLNILLAVILFAGWPFPSIQLLGIAVGASFIVAGIVSIVGAFGLRRAEREAI